MNSALSTFDSGTLVFVLDIEAADKSFALQDYISKTYEGKLQLIKKAIYAGNVPLNTIF